MIPEIYLSTASTIFDDLFSFEFANGFISNYRQSSPSFPPMNIAESKDSKFIEMKIAIAGFSKEDISITSEDEYLIIKGEKKETFDSYEKDSVKWIKKNLNNNKFERAFSFSDNYYDFRNPEVKLVDGLLTLKINKDKSLISEKKNIEIK